jgi:ribosomal protein S28E/S33
MALIVNNIRSLFFDAVTGAPRATIDDAALQAFIAACDVNVGHPDANALAAAQAMLPVGGGPLAAPAPVSAGLLTALAAHAVTVGDVLAVIAGRTGVVGDLNAIANHVNHNEASDLAVIRNPNTPEATIDIIAARLPAEHMGHIVNNPNTRPALRHQIGQELVDALNDEVAPAPVGILTHFRASIGRLAAEHQSALVPHVYKLGDRGVAVNMHSEARTAIGKLVYK